MLEQTLLGFDFGTKRIGIAVGQTLTKSAKALKRVTYRESQPDWKAIEHLIQEWQPDALVVGIPLNMDGTEQVLTLKARDFKNQLKQRFGLPVYEVDERLSSVAVRSTLFEAGGFKALQKGDIDSLAAQLILESFFAQTQ